MAKEKRVKRVTVMLAESELAKIDEAARARRVTNSDFLRRSALLEAWNVSRATHVKKESQSATRLYSS